MPTDCSNEASTSNSHETMAAKKEVSRLELCQNLLMERLKFAKSFPNSQDPEIIAKRKEISSELSEIICGKNGVKVLFMAIDQTSDPSFWNTAIACYSLASIISSVPQKSTLMVLTEIRKLMQDEGWGNKLSLFLASLIEMFEKISVEKLASSTDIVFVDFILRPFHRLFEGKYRYLSSTDGYWGLSLDSSLWIAFCWLKHSAKMKALKAHTRLDKLFSVCMVMNGRLSMLAKEQLKILCGFKSALANIITGIVGSNGDSSQEKIAKFFVNNFISISESSLPLFNFAVASKGLIEVVEDAPKARELIFKQLNLSIELSDEEATDNLDAYISSLIEFIDTVDKKDKAKLLINLWSECVQNWTSFRQDQQWSLSASKWTSSLGQKSGENIEKRRFIVEYLMSGLESVLDSIVDELDETHALKLVQISKSLISTTISELDAEFDRIHSLDLSVGLDNVMETRAKTLHLAIGLCGFALFQGDEIPKEMKNMLKELMQLLNSLIELIDENKNLPIGELQSVADSAQQMLSLGSQFLVDYDSTKKAPIVLHSTKKVNEFADCLRIIEADYSRETDGSIEIAERGHAIIILEKRFRNKCQSEIESVGLFKVFDLLSDNLRHPDSYVYLAAINALCELSSWNHKTCLPKMMFLLRNWKNETTEDSDEEDSDEESQQSKAQIRNWNKVRCQVQMGEAIAKVVLNLGDLAPSYFNELSQFFLSNAQNEDQIVSASALSGLANLILACRGKFFTKIINELIFCCECKLKRTNDAIVRRTSIHLLRSIVTSCQLGIFTELRQSCSKITSLLRRIRIHDPDPAVRLHADLALLEAETALNEVFANSLDKNTRVIK